MEGSPLSSVIVDNVGQISETETASAMDFSLCDRLLRLRFHTKQYIDSFVLPSNPANLEELDLHLPCYHGRPLLTDGSVFLRLRYLQVPIVSGSSPLTSKQFPALQSFKTTGCPADGVIDFSELTTPEFKLSLREFHGLITLSSSIPLGSLEIDATALARPSFHAILRMVSDVSFYFSEETHLDLLRMALDEHRTMPDKDFNTLHLRRLRLQKSGRVAMMTFNALPQMEHLVLVNICTTVNGVYCPKLETLSLLEGKSVPCGVFISLRSLNLEHHEIEHHCDLNCPRLEEISFRRVDHAGYFCIDRERFPMLRAVNVFQQDELEHRFPCITEDTVIDDGPKIRLTLDTDVSAQDVCLLQASIGKQWLVQRAPPTILL